MTVRDVENRVSLISAHCGDYEMAHSDEDALHVDVLRAIADGHPTPALLAEAALKTAELHFERFCA